MKLKELATKPQLVKIVLDDEETISQHEEALEFYVWDKQPLDTFVEFASNTQKPDSYPQLITMCSDMILDEDGNPVMAEGHVLPNQLLLKCVNKVVEQLGK